ncbi:MAG TPA: site-2 protease family protein [Saprospiraceae bacterium]|nr:site-2 protease family protein [Saprospiraceae bacterium]
MLRWTLNIGTYFNIPVRIHWSFLLILIYVSYISFSAGNNVEQTLIYICLVLSIFFCVLLHEYGHALSARRYGVETEDIILLPIGGMARLRSMPERPWHEIVVAVMGPVVNLIIAIIIYILLILYYRFDYAFILSLGELEMLNWTNFPIVLMQANIFLLLFNLIPCFPMDGGRILRAILAFKISRVKATKYATRIGQVMCLIFIAYGIYNSIWNLVLIGIVIFVSASMEYQHTFLNTHLKAVSCLDIAQKELHFVPEYQQISSVIQDLRATGLELFFVDTIEGHQSGVVSLKALEKKLNQDPGARVSDATVEKPVTVRDHWMVLDILQDLKFPESVAVVVSLENELKGILSKRMILQVLEGKK